MLGAPFKYIEHGYTTNRKFSKSLRKKSFESKMGVFWRIGPTPFLKLTFKNPNWLRNYELSFKKPHFSTQNFCFFHWLWESFLCVVWLRSSYLRDCLNIVLYVGKKNQERTTRQTDYTIENIKKFVFLKIQLWKWDWQAMELCFTKAHFWLKTFFSNVLRKFFMHRMTMFNISRRSAWHC